MNGSRNGWLTNQVEDQNQLTNQKRSIDVKIYPKADRIKLIKMIFILSDLVSVS